MSLMNYFLILFKLSLLLNLTALAQEIGLSEEDTVTRQTGMSTTEMATKFCQANFEVVAQKLNFDLAAKIKTKDIDTKNCSFGFQTGMKFLKDNINTDPKQLNSDSYNYCHKKFDVKEAKNQYERNKIAQVQLFEIYSKLNGCLMASASGMTAIITNEMYKLKNNSILKNQLAPKKAAPAKPSSLDNKGDTI